MCAVFSVALGLTLASARAAAQEAVSSQDGPYAQPPEQPPAPIVREPAEPPAGQPSRRMPAPLSNYDPALFQKRIPKDQLAFLGQFAGRPSNELYRDKQFHKLMKSFVPDCTYHYGWTSRWIARWTR